MLSAGTGSGNDDKRPRLRIAIATSGRFHVLDLAREMAALGHRVRFYSYVPKRRALSFGLPAECHVSLLSMVAPLVLLERKLPQLIPQTRERLMYAVLNRAVIARLEPCDVFVCMSGMYLEAPQYARDRFGAKIVIHRGNKYVLAQQEILAMAPDGHRMSQAMIERELAGYRLADRIAIASDNVEQSFRRDASSQSKIVKNPYGVDLSDFPMSERKSSSPYTFVFAGSWCWRKGCDLIVDAVRRCSGIRVLHVGPLSDVPFPTDDPRFAHLDPVNQSKLRTIYNEADAFVLASREDGFGVVLSQALASGLPVLCTTNTGGPTLKHTPALADRITVVPSGNIQALTEGLRRVVDRLHNGPPFAPLTQADRETLSWSAYAMRYEANLFRMLDEIDHRKKSTACMSQ